MNDTIALLLQAFVAAIFAGCVVVLVTLAIEKVNIIINLHYSFLSLTVEKF
jgi:hypothetical protein